MTTEPNVDDDLKTSWPLRARLTLLIVVLLGLGLTVSGITVRLVLANVMIGQVDRELEQVADDLSSVPIEELIISQGATQILPSRYVVDVALEDGSHAVLGNTSSGRPVIPPEGLPEISTVPDVENNTPWRARTYPLHLSEEGAQVGSLTLAVPLSSTERTLDRTTQIVVVTALGIVLVGAIIASGLVRHELRGLKQIERTAGAIAAGHLHRRVPPGPPGTEVGSLSNSINSMLTHIERSFSARAESEQKMRRFVSDASHELRTPLATIRGYGELYRMGGVPDGEVGQAMERIEAEATRMGTLVEDLLALARLDEHAPLRLEDVDLNQVAADAVRDLGALDPTRATSLVGAHDEPLVVRGDNAAIRQITTNLVGNAVRHTPEGTPVEIALSRREVEGREMAIIAVRDHGSGIPEEDADRIFSRFYRIDPSRNRSRGGSGLGLAIVSSAAAKHDGDIRVLTTPGGGATFEVALPVEGPEGVGHWDDDGELDASLDPTLNGTATGQGGDQDK